MTATTDPSVLDVATDRTRVAHLPCGLDEGEDTPVHALCGQPLLNIDAPSEAPKCKACQVRIELAGGTFGYLLGLAHCTTHGGDR